MSLRPLNFPLPSRRQLLSLISASLLIASTQAEIFKTIQPDGSVSYSDSASDNAKAIELEPINQVPAFKLPNKKAAPASESEADETVVYRYIKVTSPNNDQAIEGRAGNVSISLKTQPALAAGDKIRLIIDGKTHASASQSSFSLNNLSHGTHQVSAKIINPQGKTLKSSKSIRFHIFRHNSSSKRRGR